MRISLLPSLAVLALGLAASPAIAGDDVTIRVSFADLDLTDDSQVAVLKSRITDAAAEACTPTFTSDLSINASADCRHELITKGLAEVQSRRAEALAELP